MNSADEVRRKLAAAPADFRLALLFTPAAWRAAFAALLAVYVEIREILWECREAAVALDKLGWWTEEIEAFYARRPRHPLTRHLLPHLERIAAHRDSFLAIIAGVRADVSAAAYADFEDVKRQCYRHAGALAELTAALHGAAAADLLRAARLLGNTWRLADITTGGTAYALHGRVYFAAADLRAHGLDRHLHGEEPTAEGIRGLLAEYAERTRALHAEALALLPAGERPALVPWIILASLALRRVQKLAARGFAAPRVPLELPPFTALFTAWQAARRETRLATHR